MCLTNTLVSSVLVIEDLSEKKLLDYVDSSTIAQSTNKYIWRLTS